MVREEMLVKDLVYHFPQEYEEKIKSVIKISREIINIPISPFNPSKGHHPVLVFRKYFGSVKKEVPVSILELKTLNRYNMPPWKKTIIFDLDTDTAGEYTFNNTRIMYIGNSRSIEYITKKLQEILKLMRKPPIGVTICYEDIYLEHEGSKFIKLEIHGGEFRIESKISEYKVLTRIFGRALPYIESTFRSKNKEFYKLLFIYSLENRLDFESFFMRYVYPKLNPEQKEFLDEMHDYRNFITLLYDNLIRVNMDTFQDEISVRINRRVPHARPLDIAIRFTDRGIQVEREASNPLVTLYL